MRKSKTIRCNIGAVKVTTDTENPYTAGKRGAELYDKDRKAAFRKAWNHESLDGLYFWLVPPEGGAVLLTEPRRQIKDLAYWMTGKTESCYGGKPNGWHECTTCGGRIHDDTCTSKMRPRWDCCKKRHEILGNPPTDFVASLDSPIPLRPGLPIRKVWPVQKVAS